MHCEALRSKDSRLKRWKRNMIQKWEDGYISLFRSHVRCIIFEENVYASRPRAAF
jgi:hypothetical protein